MEGFRDVANWLVVLAVVVAEVEELLVVVVEHGTERVLMTLLFCSWDVDVCCCCSLVCVLRIRGGH